MADTRKIDRLSMYRRTATPKKRKARRKQPTLAAPTPTRRRAIGALPAWHVGDPDVMMI